MLKIKIVKKLMKQKRLTSSEIAKCLRKSDATVSNYLTGKRSPDFANAVFLARDIFHVDLTNIWKPKGNKK